MHDTTIQTLLNTRIEHPIDGDDVDEWVDRLTTLSEEVKTIRESDDPSLLTENEAEVIVRRYGVGQSAKEIAEAMGVSTQRIYDLLYAAEEDLLAAEATLSIIDDLRESVSPDPYEKDVGGGDGMEASNDG
jgi:DNA-directed RNA polymerase specialized sigma24 family protein